MKNIHRLLLRIAVFLFMAVTVEDIMTEGIGFLLIYGFIWLSLSKAAPTDLSEDYWNDDS